MSILKFLVDGRGRQSVGFGWTRQEKLYANHAWVRHLLSFVCLNAMVEWQVKSDGLAQRRNDLEIHNSWHK